jgi:hypothetical protein
MISVAEPLDTLNGKIRAVLVPKLRVLLQALQNPDNAVSLFSLAVE